jgi:hypothetical protein
MARCRSRSCTVRVGAALSLAVAGSGCGGSSDAVMAPDGSVGPDASLGFDGSVSSDASDGVHGSDSTTETDAPLDGNAPPCTPADSAPVCPPSVGLQCSVNSHCADGGTTSLSGTVYDPAGRNPIYNAAVFVPRFATLAPIATGTSSCNACVAPIGDYVTATLTDATGSFTLTGVPTGVDIPLVVQSGKWRRMVQIPEVADCTDTPVPAESSRLPRNHTEGDMPQMALLTGGCDNVACFVRSVGVDAAEFSAPHAGGRVDVYRGLGAVGTGAPLSGGVAGDCTTDACPLWSSRQSLEFYDSVFLGCECSANGQTKSPSSVLALHDWLDEGGSVFATHSQATWFKNGPADFQGIANWTDGPASGATGPFAVALTTPKGMTFQQWLANVGAVDAQGRVLLDPADVSTSVTTVGPLTTDWIDDTSTAAEGGGPLSGDVKALSFATPADAGLAPCGKVYFTDIHAGGGQALEDPDADAPAPAAVPGACDGGPMTAEEKALEFLLFNNSICIGGTSKPPPPLPPCPAPDGG